MAATTGMSRTRASPDARQTRRAVELRAARRVVVVVRDWWIPRAWRPQPSASSQRAGAGDAPVARVRMATGPSRRVHSTSPRRAANTDGGRVSARVRDALERR